MLLIGSVLATPAWACRCPQEPLATYFERADVVFLGKVVGGTESPDPSRPERPIRFELKGAAFKGRLSETDRYYTAADTAGCGLDAVAGRLYLVFGERDPREPEVVYVNTCNGTRRFEPANPDGIVGFSDAPPNRVLPALLDLSRAEEARHLPIGGIPKAHSIVGLVELPGIVTYTVEGVSAATVPNPGPLSLREQPDPGAPVVAQLQAPADVVTREHSYEAVAAVVYEERQGWLRLKTSQGIFGWLAPTAHAVYYPLATLLVRRLGYLTSAWDGRVWPEPGAGYPLRLHLPKEVQRETPIEVIETQQVGDSLWLRIQVFRSEPCSGPAPQKGETGWVPAWNAEGELTSWYWSRGC